jgi:hypothetical protein
MDGMGNISRYFGLDVAGDRMLPSRYLVIGTQGKSVYGIQSPMAIRRVPSATKTNDILQVEQYDCEDSPEPASSSLVLITS